MDVGASGDVVPEVVVTVDVEFELCPVVSVVLEPDLFLVLLYWSVASLMLSLFSMRLSWLVWSWSSPSSSSVIAS